MRFWDSSALVSLLVEEEASPWCRDLLRDDSDICVWLFTRTEMVSAVRRKQRNGELSRGHAHEAMERLSALAKSWNEVSAVDLVRDRADRLLAVHPLRAEDALQLAAALVLVQERPADFPIVTADDRLADAARSEGFLVVTP